MTEPRENTLPDGDPEANRSTTEPDPFATGMTAPTDIVNLSSSKPSEPVDPFATAGVVISAELPADATLAKPIIRHKVPGYELLSVLGQGGMGIVYKARHVRMKRLVAIKIIRGDCVIPPDSIERFNKEIEAAARLTHPNVVMAFDADEVDGLIYFVMEYIEGFDLTKVVRSKGPLPVEEACDYIRQAALGLQHAHERGLVHRDIKPSNLLVTKDEGVVKVLDMGLARLQESAAGQPACQLTGTGAVMGTPDFMSPEQSRDSRQVDIRSDIYSLGCSFYYLLTAQVPYPEGTYTEKLLKHCLDEPKPATELRPNLPPDVAAVLVKSMAKQPADRYQTPRELAEALEAFAPPRHSPPRLAASGTEQRWLASTDASVKASAIAAGPRLSPTTFGLPESKPATRPPLETDRTIVVPAKASRRLVPLALLLLAVLGGAGAIIAFTGVLSLPGGSTPLAATVVETRTSPAVPTVPETRPATPPKTTRPDTPPPPPPPPPTLTGVLVRFEKPVQPGPVRTALSSNGEWAAAGYDGRAVLWRVPETALADKPTARVETLFSPTALAVQADGSRVAMIRKADDPSTPAGEVAPVLWFVSSWSTKGVAPDRLLRGQKPAFTAVALSTRGNYALSGDEDWNVRLWDIENREVKVNLGQTTAQVSSVALSPDGRYVLAGDRSGKTFLWDLDEPKKKPAIFKRHASTVTCLAFSPDGRLALSAGFDKVISLYDVKTGEYRSSFEGHTETVRCLAFLPDNVHFLSGGEDMTLRLWTVAGREQLQSYNDHNVGVQSVAASADGKYAVFICSDLTIRRLALPGKLP